MSTYGSKEHIAELKKALEESLGESERLLEGLSEKRLKDIDRAFSRGIWGCVVVSFVGISVLIGSFYYSEAQVAQDAKKIFAFYYSEAQDAKEIAECTFVLALDDNGARFYECPNGLVYAVKGNLRNAKGE